MTCTIHLIIFTTSITAAHRSDFPTTAKESPILEERITNGYSEEMLDGCSAYKRDGLSKKLHRLRKTP
jgi:hypothetical protein